MRRLVLKLTTGAEAPERANQGLTVAGTALAAGAEVSLWLTGDAVWFATLDRCPDLGLEHSASAADLIEAVLHRGRVTVCTQCAARRSLTQADLDDRAHIAGAATFVEEALTYGVQAIVY